MAARTIKSAAKSGRFTLRAATKAAKKVAAKKSTKRKPYAKKK